MKQAGGLLAAFAVGLLIAVQSRVNGALGARLADGPAAAVISFGSGFVILLVLTAVLPRVRSGLRAIVADVRRTPGAATTRLSWWMLVGGLAGAYLVAVQSSVVSTIGVAVFLVAVVAGQTVSSLFVDRIGLGPAGRAPVTPPRLLGAVIAVVAVVVSVADQFGHPKGLLLAVLPAIAGVLTAVQQALNGRVAGVGSVVGNGGLAAGLLNFAVGLVGLLVLLGIRTAARGLPRGLPGDPLLYIGGACGVAFIVTSAVIVGRVGVFVLSLGAVAGQLVGSLVLDLVVPAAGHRVAVTTVLGCLLALAGVVIATVWSRHWVRTHESHEPHGTDGTPVS